MSQIKRILSPWSLQYIKRTFGDIKYLENTKAFYSIFLCQNSNKLGKSSLNVVLKNEFTPSFDVDWEMFCFLRSLCNVYVSTGEIARKENNTTNLCKAQFFDHEDWKDLFYLKSDKKLNFILSRKFRKEDLLNMTVIRAPHLRTLLTMNKDLQKDIDEDQQLQEFIARENIQFSPKMDSTLDAANYIKQLYPNEKILYELGIKSMKQILDVRGQEYSPLETLVISVYKGELDKSFIGDEHPSIELLKEKFNLVHVSEQFPVQKGHLQFYVFINNSININKTQNKFNYLQPSFSSIPSTSFSYYS